MSGGKKPEKPRVERVTSQYAGVNQAGFDTDFGSGFSTKTPILDAAGNLTKQFELTSSTKLADFLQPIPRLAGEGIQGNLGFLQLTPQQQYDQAVGGNNPLYNLLSEQTKRQTDAALGRSLVDSYGTGTSNSTTAGAAQGMILNDEIMRRNNDLLNAINFGNEQGRANLGANLNTLGSMANLVYPLGSAANANLTQGFTQQDSVALANAQAANQANREYAEAMNNYNQRKSAGLGKMIGTGLAIGAAPFTGGASLMSIPSMWGGGSTPAYFGSRSAPSYAPAYSGSGFGSPVSLLPQGGFNFGTDLFGRAIS